MVYLFTFWPYFLSSRWWKSVGLSTQRSGFDPRPVQVQFFNGKCDIQIQWYLG